MKKLLTLFFLCLMGCSPLAPEGEECAPANRSRCSTDNRVELCSPQGHWIIMMDCNIGDGWYCAETTEGHSCLWGNAE